MYCCQVPVFRGAFPHPSEKKRADQLFPNPVNKQVFCPLSHPLGLVARFSLHSKSHLVAVKLERPLRSLEVP